MPKHTHTISLALAAVLVALPACSKAQDTPQAPDPDPTTQVTGEGLPELIAAIRESLVPTTVLRDPCPWAFWEA